MREDYVWSDGTSEVLTPSKEEAFSIQEKAGTGKVWKRYFAVDGMMEGIELLSKAPVKKRERTPKVQSSAAQPEPPSHHCAVCGTPLWDAQWPYAACQPCGQKMCIHGNTVGECPDCDADGDRAYDVSKGN